MPTEINSLFPQECYHDLSADEVDIIEVKLNNVTTNDVEGAAIAVKDLTKFQV